jgi:DNA-binding HxlR family transcriptional regulator
MASLLVKQEFRQKTILAELSHGPQGYIELLKHLGGKGLSPGVFQATFRQLQSCERVKKTALVKRAPWVITEKGQKLLEVLS